MYDQYWNDLEYLDVSSFDADNVTHMSFMFELCSVESLDLSSFDTRKVMEMNAMFEFCFNLKEVLVGKTWSGGDAHV